MEESPDLRPFFEPRGIVLVGATRTPGFGYGIPLSMRRHGWGDRLFLVNPRGGELHGMRVYRKVAEVPGPADLAVVIVPAKQVPAVMEELGQRGIRHAIVESAGFAEAGEEGRLLQDEALRAARRHGVRVIGPNCVGVVNTANRLATVEVLEEAMTPGGISLVAQSGVFGNILLDTLYERELHVAKAVTLGNRMDVDECDVLDFLAADERTRAIAMYLEGAADGRRLLEALRRTTARKPVLVLKSGRTGPGRAATASHTASLSGEDRLYDAALRQSGALRAETLEELIDAVRVLSALPPARGRCLGIVTSSGSLGVLATDMAVREGLEVPPLPGEVNEALRGEVPTWINLRNPLDVGPSLYFTPALRAMLESQAVDMVLAITVIPYAVLREWEPLGMDAKAWFGDIASLREEFPYKPLAVCAVGNSAFVSGMREAAGPGVPVLTSPETAARAMAMLYGLRRPS